MRKTYLLVILAVALYACKKESITEPPTPPTPPLADTTQQTSDPEPSLLPQSISFVKAGAADQNVTVSFQYLTDQHQINVYWDDTTTANRYDKLAYSYFYNNDGFVTKREGYDPTGNLYENITIERMSDNAVQTVFYNSIDAMSQSPVKDTFAVSVADSVNNPSFKIMTVAHTYRSPWLTPTDPVPIVNRVTFHNNVVLKESGGQYYGQRSYSSQPPLEYGYDASGKRVSEIIDGGTDYTTAYSYETTGHALDSFFQVLRGKDGYMLDTEAFWGMYPGSNLTITPLSILLSTPNHVGMVVNAHQYGILKEVRSVPSGTDLSFAETFNFENTLDAYQRITKTNITHNGSFYATWKITY